MKLNFKIEYQEIIIVLAILFFTILSDYVSIEEYIIKVVKHSRWVQLLSVFVVSLSLIMSYKGKFDITLNYILNASIITLLFSLITKPKPIFEKKIKNIENKIDSKVHDMKMKNEIAKEQQKLTSTSL
jgi:hypothetical protein